MADDSRQDILFRFRQVVLDIARNLGIEELEQAKYLCTDFLPVGRREMITSTLQLFEELEKQRRVGIDDWSLVKDLLRSLHRFDLLAKVDQFDLDRSLRFVNLNSQHGQLTDSNASTNGANIDHAPDSNYDTYLGKILEQKMGQSQRSPGELTVKCALKLAATGAWVAGSAFIFKRYINEPEELIRLVSTVVVPTGLMVKFLSWGSVKINLQATDLQALRELWLRYQDGRLKKKLEEVLVTEELKKLSQGEDIVVSVHIQEQEYRTACLDLMLAHIKETKLHRSLCTPPRRSSCPGFPAFQCTLTADTHLRAMQVVAWHERQRNTLLTSELQRAPQWTQKLESCNQKHKTKLKLNFTKDDQTKPKMEGEDDLVSRFLSKSECDELCTLLDPPAPFGNDWKMLASELDFKMGQIRWLERAESPTRAFLKRAIEKCATLSVSELVGILGKISRNDAVKLLTLKDLKSASSKGNIMLCDVPYSVRWKLAYHMDANIDLFYNFVEKCDNSLLVIDVRHLLKAKSPTIALLYHLDAKFPNFTVAHLRQILNEVQAYNLEEILETFVKSECNKNADTIRRSSSFMNPRVSRLRIDGQRDAGERGSGSVDSGLSVDNCRSPTSSSVEIEYDVGKQEESNT